MNIELKNIDPVNAILKIDIEKNDYAEKVEKSLRDIRQKADIPGFRKGMIPMGLVKKMYGKAVMAEEINKLLSSQLSNYIKDQELNILGEPLPNETEQPKIDFETQEDFTFCFDLGLAPEMNVQLTKADALPYYTIAVTDEAVDQQIASLRAGHGNYVKVEEIEEKDIAKGLLVELNDDGSEKEGGIIQDNVVFMPFYMKGKSEKAKFIGANKDAVIMFNPYTAYEGNAVELASFLKITKEEIDDHQGNFSFSIREITRYTEAELNVELYDTVFKPGTVTTEEEFRRKMKEMISIQYTPDSDYKLLLDAKQLLVQKNSNVQLPDAFLKRWMLATNKDSTPNSVEDEYPKINSDLKFQLIKDEIAKENNFKIEDNELLNAAKKSVRSQFAQYGMPNVPANSIEQYAKDLLKEEKSVRNLIDREMENKLINWIKGQVSLDLNEVTVDEFRQFFEKQTEAITE